MKKHILVAALIQLCLVSALPNTADAAPMRQGLVSALRSAGDAAPIKVGSLKIYPVLEVGEKYNDNIFEQESVKTSSWITTVDPLVTVVAEKGANHFEASYRLSSGTYHSSHTDDYIDHFAGINIAFGLTKRLDIKAWADYSKTHNTRGTTFTGTPTGPNKDKYHETEAGAEVSYGVRARIDVKGEYTSKRYDNNRAKTQKRDLDTTDGRVALSFPLAPKTRGVLEVRYKHLDFKFFSATRNDDSNEQRYFAGLDWDATAKTSGAVRLGYLQKDFSNPLFSTNSLFSWELDIKWAPKSYSRWKLATSSMPQVSDGSDAYTLNTGGELSWKHEWSSRFSHTAYIGYEEKKYQEVTVPRMDRETTAGLSLDYQLFRWLALGAGYDFTNRNSNKQNASHRQNIWSFRILGTL
jgi:hypothetical protein